MSIYSAYITSNFSIKYLINIHACNILSTLARYNGTYIPHLQLGYLSDREDTYWRRKMLLLASHPPTDSFPTLHDS